MNERQSSLVVVMPKRMPCKKCGTEIKIRTDRGQYQRVTGLCWDCWKVQRKKEKHGGRPRQKLETGKCWSCKQEKLVPPGVHKNYFICEDCKKGKRESIVGEAYCSRQVINIGGLRP